MNAIRLQDVNLDFQDSASASSSYGQSAQSVLRHVNCEIQRGQFVSIIGPSGCGKTSLLRIVAGLQPVSSGLVEFESSRNETRFGYVFQDPNLLSWRSVFDNVALPLEIKGNAWASFPKLASRRSHEVTQIVSDTLRKVGLEESDFAKQPHQLSGGMRMRVSLARAIVTQPDIMLFDEPFAALDDLSRSRLNEEILRLREAHQWTAVFVTHNVSEAVFLSDQVILLGDDASAASIQKTQDITFAAERDYRLRSTPEFNELTLQLTSALRGDAG